MKNSEKEKQAELAMMFKALGDPTRLRIFEYLRSCCGPVAVREDGEARPIQGMTVGAVCCYLTGSEKVSSTISFHLKELRHARLIQMERNGKNLVCSINPEAVHLLGGYFTALPAEINCPCDDPSISLLSEEINA